MGDEGMGQRWIAKQSEEDRVLRRKTDQCGY